MVSIDKHGGGAGYTIKNISDTSRLVVINRWIKRGREIIECGGFYMDFLISFFSSSANVFFVLLFAAAWIWYYFSFYQPLQMRKRGIESLSRKLKGYDRDSASERYDELDAMMSGTRDAGIGDNWKSYKKVHIRARNTSGNGFDIFSTENAEEFFDLRSLTRGLDLQFWQNLAGIFTGLGILGTFVGLSLGIAPLAQGVTKEGIQELLGGMMTAFITSIIGIICGIAFNYAHSRVVMGFSSAAEGLTGELERLFMYTSAEQLMSSHLTEAKEQTRALKAFSSDLAIALGNMGNQMGVSIDAAVVAINNKLDQVMALQRADAKEQAAVLGSFREDIAGSFNKAGDRLQGIETAVKVLNNIGGEAITASLNKKMGETIAGFNDSMKSQIDTNRKLQSEAVEAIRTAAEAMGAAVVTIQQQEEGLRSAAGHLQEVMNGANGLVSEAGAAAGKFVDAGNSVTQTLADMGHCSEQMSDAAKEMKAGSEKLQEAVRNSNDILQTAASNSSKSAADIKESLQKTEAAWHVYENKFNGVKDGLAATFKELRAGIDEYNGKTSTGLTTNLQAFDAAITKAIGQLAGSRDDLRNELEDLNRSLGELSRSVEHLSQRDR